MQKFSLLRGFIAVAILLFWAIPAAAGCAPATVRGADRVLPSGALDTALIDAAILVEVNYQRCLHGLPGLAADPRLRQSTSGHSAWMAATGKVSHKSGQSGQRTLTQRLHNVGVTFQNAAENIAQLNYYQFNGQSSYQVIDASRCKFATLSGQPLPRHSYRSLAQAVVAQWMASRGHRRNILNPAFHLHGSAAVVNAGAGTCGMVYLAENFAD